MSILGLPNPSEIIVPPGTMKAGKSSSIGNRSSWLLCLELVTPESVLMLLSEHLGLRGNLRGAVGVKNKNIC